MVLRYYLQTEGCLNLAHVDIIINTMQKNTHRHRGEVSLSISKVFGVSSLCDDLSRGLVGQVNRGECKRSSLFENLCSDEHILTDLGSIHVSA